MTLYTMAPSLVNLHLDYSQVFLSTPKVKINAINPGINYQKMAARSIGLGIPNRQYKPKVSRHFF